MFRRPMTMVTTVTVMVMTMSVAYGANQADPCAEHVNGCSIPFGLDFFFKDEFTPACNRHDVCYRCGVLYNKTQKVCDDAFLLNMKAACKSRKPQHRRSVNRQAKRDECDAIAEGIYYTSVRIFGHAFLPERLPNSVILFRFLCSVLFATLI